MAHEVRGRRPAAIRLYGEGEGLHRQRHRERAYDLDRGLSRPVQAAHGHLRQPGRDHEEPRRSARTWAPCIDLQDQAAAQRGGGPPEGQPKRCLPVHQLTQLPLLLAALRRQGTTATRLRQRGEGLYQGQRLLGTAVLKAAAQPGQCGYIARWDSGFPAQDRGGRRHLPEPRAQGSGHPALREDRKPQEGHRDG